MQRMAKSKQKAPRNPKPPPAADPPSPAAKPGRLAAPLALYVVALVSAVVDQGTKILTHAKLDLHESVPVVDGWFAFTYVLNEGAAFSFLRGQVTVLLAITAVIAIGIVIYERRLGPRPAIQNIALGLILGGAIGNLIDRFRFGAVVDMLDLQNGSGKNIWPIFNVADIVLVVGIGLLTIAMLRAPRPQSPPHA
jgi:signal peptidase II